MDEVRTKRERAQYLIAIQKAEINTLGKRIDHAKNEKRADDQKRTETEKKGLELKLRTLERWRDVWDAAIGVSEAKRDAAQLSRKLVEVEQQLGDMRQARFRNPADSTRAGAAPDENLLRQIRRVLDSRRDEADARRALAERQRELAEKQRELLEAQLAVQGLSG